MNTAAWFLLLPLLCVAGLVSSMVIRWILRTGQARHKTADTPATDPVCCKCGYNLTGLNFPRCPECGTLRGFDVPLDHLPLTDDERRLIDARCRERDADRTSSHV